MGGEQAHLQRLCQQLTADCTSADKKAIALHNYVRDISFGWTPYFDLASPALTIALKTGHCNPKGELFVALLKAAGIEARLHAVNIKADVLHGCFPDGAGPAAVTHTYTEVLLGSKWVKVDSYVVDGALFRQAQARLRQEGRTTGYGIHVEGTVEWDGKSDAFVQYVPQQQSYMTVADLGQIDSTARLMSEPLYLQRGVQRVLTPFRLMPGWFMRMVNARVQAVRQSNLAKITPLG
uniref:Transglutaminase-like domain-containing protein n=1 Tax=Chlamydomonas chlamydogama TaxID=225041 RepID=A0A7S2VVB6_9CHLO|mmetsp:Transcript_1559/g.3530  ORF Transcript_1559/g.3530 Transcript_1559/m.3530 type:complete len:236 (+) Transcript_1559:102-809(+)|eukprot:CAMPEP_0202891316 /NCGR_PEP_ID=MMETSP1392-20130828/1409_1 /ASSEMBLY_ACC=CAM_ASM_000868 /TAXON_ID=225041 /ORGANISM="Chlamydomonas chlamydogama, Strain SAG 11-48b" /LENGTH=235 /DNA_ID=CAMNT_0049575029 /DNA_START=54 /DNA_END=761 /DNA_ORIENTATION=+